MKEFFNIDEIAEYLGMKKSSIYSKVERKEIPHYKVGTLLRFRKSDIDGWMEGLKNDPLTNRTPPRKASRTNGHARSGINALITRSIEEASPMNYTSPYGKPDRARGQ